jgi:hypothetical protein
MKKEFVVCLDDSDYEGDLEFGKVYQRIQDKTADMHYQIRIIDGSGESYVYPARRFGNVDITTKVKKCLVTGFANR